jgi:hypothetical protein
VSSLLLLVATFDGSGTVALSCVVLDTDVISDSMLARSE